MKATENTFISSTFLDRTYRAYSSLKNIRGNGTFKIMGKDFKIGLKNGKRLENVAKYEIKLDLSGLPALISFSIQSKDWNKYKTYITQEMLKKVSYRPIPYVCTEHTENVVNAYFDALDSVFSTIADCENGQNVDDLLEGPVCHVGFKRLN